MLAFCIFLFIVGANSFRVLSTNGSSITGAYFRPFDKGFVGRTGDPTTFQRERINEGAFDTPTKELLYEGVYPRQNCPGMVGPFSDGNFYCTAREFGYCDRRSGACFCNVGYQGIDCSECSPTHFMVGINCFPKKLCPNDCNGAGTCDYWTGTCSCEIHRVGPDCSIRKCTNFDPLCQSCTDTECLLCLGGYYLTGNSSRVCSSCYDFDPRCAGCTLSDGCTVCADPILTSIRRSGYRASDPQLPIEEDTREFSITLPFGTKSAESFAEAESFFIASTPDKPLHNSSQTCSQGLYGDDSWDCSPYPASHIVCGHLGVVSFTYPNYVVAESDASFRVAVRRSGGGVGNISVTYYIQHFTTTDSDVAATAYFTTSQDLVFSPGIVERTFLLGIHDNNVVDGDRVFQVVLQNPEGGGSLGPQYRTNITILDDDASKCSHSKTYPLTTSVTTVAGTPFSVDFQAVTGLGAAMTLGGEHFLALVEDYSAGWRVAGNEDKNSKNWTAGKIMVEPSRGQRFASRTNCGITDFGNGIYSASCNLYLQGTHELRIWHAFPGGLRGDYYYDAFFQNLALSRIDRFIDYRWGYGRLIPRGKDYMSIRWTGLLKPQATGVHYFYFKADDYARVWIDGDLLLDHFHQSEAYSEPVRRKFLTLGQFVEIEIEYVEVINEAYAAFMWGLSPTNLTVIPSDYLYSIYPIANMPIEVTVLSSETTAATTECSGDGLFWGRAGEVSSFSFCPMDQFYNIRDDVYDDGFYLQSELYSSSLHLTSTPNTGVFVGYGSEIIYPTITYDNTTNCFTGKYTPVVAGDYVLNITYQSDWRGNASTELPLIGAPFDVHVTVADIYAPYCNIYGLPKVTTLNAGQCFNFTIVSRDKYNNLLFRGGDEYEAYIYRVNPFGPVPAQLVSQVGGGTSAPSATPTSTPTLSPTGLVQQIGFSLPVTYDTDEEVVRYGVIDDLQNTGNYSVKICPVIAGNYEVYVVLKGSGAVNAFSDTTLAQSYSNNEVSEPSRYGQYVAQTPYSLIVLPEVTAPSPYTTRAYGEGLSVSTVGLPSYFMVTVRDAYDNVIASSNSISLTARLVDSPLASVHKYDFQNGSYLFDYTPVIATNVSFLEILLNGAHIRGSPFQLIISEGQVSARLSYAIGDGLHVGTAGVASFFELYSFDFQGNRMNSTDDVYVFDVVGDYDPRIGANVNIFSGTMLPCSLNPAANPIYLNEALAATACHPIDDYLGHFWGTFTPVVSGNITISIYLVNAKVNALDSWSTTPKTLVGNVNYTAHIVPSIPVAVLSTVQGDLYDIVAGEYGYVTLQLWDIFGNRVTGNGLGSRESLELAVLGVARDWNSSEVINYNGLPLVKNGFAYEGFFAGLPRTYGDVTDYGDGTYKFGYRLETAGNYVVRLALAEHGLNVTFYNNSNLQIKQTSKRYITARDYTWTGNTQASSELQEFYSLVADTVDLDLTGSLANRNIGYSLETHTPFLSHPHGNISKSIPALVQPSSPVISNAYILNAGTDFAGNLHDTSALNLKFREEEWSARWHGMITPEFAEEYTFSMEIDDTSEGRLYIGGVGSITNSTWEVLHATDQQLVLAGNTYSTGRYSFTDVKSREFVFEYIHGDHTSASVRLFWESFSTPRSVIPASAFHHWRNISFYNHTVHPAALSPHTSNAVGDALFNAVVGFEHSFLINARDRFGNLVQRGGDKPSMVAIGPLGVAFRGIVEDYGNSTYRISYYPTMAGSFKMYVSMGCCPSSPSVGLATEIQNMQPLLVSGAPFLLTVSPAVLDPERSFAYGQGTLGGYAGDVLSFTVKYRDLHNNPTTLALSSASSRQWGLRVSFVDRSTGSLIASSISAINTASIQITHHDSRSEISYNLTNAGNYDMMIVLVNELDASETPVSIMGSPHRLRISPNKANTAVSITRGLGLRSATSMIDKITEGSSQRSVLAYYEVQLRDSYDNPLLHGGHKFYMRLKGSGNFANPNIVVIPSCIDKNNGKYVCSYQPRYSGPHLLTIMMANYNVNHTGGLGVTGKYFLSSSGAKGSLLSTANVAWRIDSTMTFNWPNIYDDNIDFFLTPGVNSPQTVFPVSDSANTRSTGFSVAWSGYLYIPRDDQYKFRCGAISPIGALLDIEGLDCALFIDEDILFSSEESSSYGELSMQQEVLYVVRVFVTISPALAQSVTPFSFRVDWSTPMMSWTVIPQFYLFDSANHIGISPYAVDVKAS